MDPIIKTRRNRLKERDNQTSKPHLGFPDGFPYLLRKYWCRVVVRGQYSI